MPAGTVAVARAAFPKGSRCLDLRDALGPIFDDGRFVGLFAACGRPAECPWRLAVVTLLRFAEDLSDRRAADAVRGRIDWKYLLGLDLADPGFDASVLSEFRTRLVAGGAEALLFDTLLDLARERGLLSKQGRQRTDSTHVLGAVRARPLRLRRRDPARGAQCARSRRPRLAARPRRPGLDRPLRPAGGRPPRAARRAFAERVGQDGHALLAAVMVSDAPSWLREVPAVEVLRRVWVQAFTLDEGNGTASRADRSVGRWWSQAEGFPPSLLMAASPYDPGVHYAKKRTTTAWIGYKVHLAEACNDGRPPLITHVVTTPAPVRDRAALAPIHAALEEKGLLPGHHPARAGHLDADQLIASARDHSVALIGPAPRDNQWQGRTSGAFMLEDFALDWDRRVATCPEGRESLSWSDERDLGRTTMRIRFSTTDCKACPSKPRCTRGARRILTPRPREEHEALVAARARETEPAFVADRRRRAGIEGTLSRGLRAMGLRRARHIGLAKTRLQHLVTAAAINLMRLAA